MKAKRRLVILIFLFITFAIISFAVSFLIDRNVLTKDRKLINTVQSQKEAIRIENEIDKIFKAGELEELSGIIKKIDRSAVYITVLSPERKDYKKEKVVYLTKNTRFIQAESSEGENRLVQSLIEKSNLKSGDGIFTFIDEKGEALLISKIVF